jgi:transposase
MRGQQERTGPLFSYISTEDRIPASHPLRQVRRLADQALDCLNPTFCKLYPEGGRPSIPPEQQLLALLLQAIYGIRSERIPPLPGKLTLLHPDHFFNQGA